MQGSGESARSAGGRAAGPLVAKRGRGGNLLAETRRRRILDWLQEEGSARVRALSEAFGVSEPTIRQRNS